MQRFRNHDVFRLLEAGAMIQDRSSSFIPSPEDEDMYAVYLQGVLIGFVDQDTIDLLEENLSSNHPLYVRDTLATPHGIDRYWFHRDNEVATILSVEVSYQHPNMAHMSVVYSSGDLMSVDSAEYGYRVLESTFRDDSSDPLSAITDEEDEEDDEEGDEESEEEEEEEEDDLDTDEHDELEWVVYYFYRGDDQTADPRMSVIMAANAKQAEERLLSMSPAGTEVPNFEGHETRLATTDDVPEEEEEVDDQL